MTDEQFKQMHAQSPVRQQQFAEYARSVAVIQHATMTLLVAKGLVTQRELDQALAMAQAQVDQKFEQVRDDAIAEWKRERPDEAKAVGLLHDLLRGAGQ